MCVREGSRAVNWALAAGGGGGSSWPANANAHFQTDSITAALLSFYYMARLLHPFLYSMPAVGGILSPDAAGSLLPNHGRLSGAVCYSMLYFDIMHQVISKSIVWKSCEGVLFSFWSMMEHDRSKFLLLVVKYFHFLLRLSRQTWFRLSFFFYICIYNYIGTQYSFFTTCVAWSIIRMWFCFLILTFGPIRCWSRRTG